MTKLLYIANARIPTEKAHGIQIMKTCEALASLHAEVELVVPTRKNSIQQNPFEYYGVERNFKITRLKTPDPTFVQWFGPGWYIKVQGSLFSFSVNSYLSKINLQETVLYTRDEYLLPILQRFTPRGVVWEAHNLPIHKDYYLKYWQNCAVIIAISQGLKQELVKLGIEENKITVAPDGVDLEKFKAKSEKQKIRRELGLSESAKIVMYTGHLYDWKGAGTLLETAKQFSIFNFQFSVLFIFVGGTEDDVKKFKEKAGSANNVLILGHKPYSEIPKYLAAADVLVLPNSAKAPISRFYTSPLKMFEYMAAGTPIVASDLPSIREILTPPTSPSPRFGEAGPHEGGKEGGVGNAVLVEPDNPEALAEGIGHVLRNPDLASKISQQALKDVQKYGWKQRAKILLDTF